MPLDKIFRRAFTPNPLSPYVAPETSVYDAPGIWVDLAEQDRAYQELQQNLLISSQLAQIYQGLAPGQTVDVRIEGINTEEHGSWLEVSPLWKPVSSPHIVEVQTHGGLIRVLEAPGSPGTSVLTLHRPTDIHNDLCRSPQYVNTTFRVNDGAGHLLQFNIDKARLPENEKPNTAPNASGERFARPGDQEQRAQLESVAKRELEAQRQNAERKARDDAQREKDQSAAREADREKREVEKRLLDEREFRDGEPAEQPPIRSKSMGS